MNPPPVPVPPTWHRREPPLTPSAVLAEGAAVPALGAATAARLSGGADLRVSANDGWLLILGAPAELPWADGVTYLGWDGGLLVPTTRACEPSPDLVREALTAQFSAKGFDLFVLLAGTVLVSARPLRPADPARLLAAP